MQASTLSLGLILVRSHQMASQFSPRTAGRGPTLRVLPDLVFHIIWVFFSRHPYQGLGPNHWGGFLPGFRNRTRQDAWPNDYANGTTIQPFSKRRCNDRLALSPGMIHLERPVSHIRHVQKANMGGRLPELQCNSTEAGKEICQVLVRRFVQFPMQETKGAHELGDMAFELLRA